MSEHARVHPHDHDHHHGPRSRAETQEAVDRYVAFDERRRAKQRMVRDGELNTLEPIVGGTSRLVILAGAFGFDRFLHKMTGTGHAGGVAGAAVADSVRTSQPVGRASRFLNRVVLTPPVRSASRAVIGAWRATREQPAFAVAHDAGQRHVVQPIRNAWSHRKRIVATRLGAASGAAASVTTFLVAAGAMSGEMMPTSGVAQLAGLAAGMRFTMETDVYRVPARYVAEAWRHLPDRLRQRHDRSIGREVVELGRNAARATADEWRNGPAEAHQCHHGPGVIRQFVRRARNQRRAIRGQDPLPPIRDYTPESVDDVRPLRGAYNGISASSVAVARQLASRVVGEVIPNDHPDADLFRNVQAVLIKHRARASERFSTHDTGPRFWLSGEGGAREFARSLAAIAQRRHQRGEVAPRFNLDGFGDEIALHLNAAMNNLRDSEIPFLPRDEAPTNDATHRAQWAYQQIDAAFDGSEHVGEQERRARHRLANVLATGRAGPNGIRIDAQARTQVYEALRTLTDENGMEAPGIIDHFDPATAANLRHDLQQVAQRRAATFEPYVGRHRLSGQRVRPEVCACDDGDTAGEHEHHEHEHHEHEQAPVTRASPVLAREMSFF